MDTQIVSEGEFNVLQFEKQLTTLKDSQEAINNCCQWCLKNRIHHKKIVNAWLNVLKRVKVEQRLILFYLANDVVQYSKRRNFDFVESWGIALQKATTMVRDDKVKHKILRIFKIWEQRRVYNEEFISDLCGLLSVIPSAPKSDEPHEFQPNYVINKIKNCAKLEKDTDIKLKDLQEHNPEIQFDDGLLASLKDRAPLDDVGKEIEVFVTHMEDYVNALKLEIKNRITLISVLKQAESQLEADRKDVKVVSNAYKMFGQRVKTFQRKLEEHKDKLASPVPSPDVNAPSPSPDSDLDLPDESSEDIISVVKEAVPAIYNPKAELYSAGYYTPILNTSANTSADVSNSFLSTNGFSSFIGSETFNLENFSSTLFSNVSNFNSTNDSSLENKYSPPATTSAQNLPVKVETPSTQSSYGYGTSHIPLLPPPMPPFTKSEGRFGNSGSYDTTTTDSNAYGNTYTTPSYETTDVNYTSDKNFGNDVFEPPIGANPYPPSEEYNPEEEVLTWEPDACWDGIPPAVRDTDTPESPPMFEKEGYNNPVEYHHSQIARGELDVYHRVVGLSNELDDSMSSLGAKEVDHRNLISLTGSPGQSSSQNSATDNIWNQTDQDYKIPPPSLRSGDKDCRLGFNLDQLKLPPPPPPPAKFQELDEPTPLLPLVNPQISPPQRSSPDNVDMDMSDDEGRHKHDNLKIIIGGSKNNNQSYLLEPPPPLPELLDDVDANSFLDNLNSDVNEFGNMENLEDSLNTSMLVPLPTMMNFNELVGQQLLPPPMNTSLPPPPPLQPLPMMMGQPGPLPLPPNPWLQDDELDLLQINNQGSGPGYSEENNRCDDIFSPEMEGGQQSDWTHQGPPMLYPLFRGRGNRLFFVKRGRGRGGPGQFQQENNNFRGNFRGHRGNRGGNRNNRVFSPRGGNFRGNFRGGF